MSDEQFNRLISEMRLIQWASLLSFLALVGILIAVLSHSA